MAGDRKRKHSSSSSEDEEEENIKTSPAKRETSKELVPISEIEFKFLLRDAETVTEGLTKFISTSEAHNDGVPCIDVVSKYLKSSSKCEELFGLLEQTDTSLKENAIAHIFKCLEQVLTRIRTDMPKILSAGEAIVQKILVVHMGKVYKCLQTQSKSNVVKSTVQLLISMVMLSEKSKKAVQTRLNFSHVAFAALFKRRNRKDPKDVRSCMVLLTLAFFVNSENSIVTAMVQQKTFLQMVISGLKFDAKEVVVDVLLTLLDKVVKNTGVSKTDKAKLFSEVVLRQLGELHQWQGPLAWSPSGGKHSQEAKKTPEETSSRSTEDLAQVAGVADSFLHELCCSHKNGIAFYDKMVGTGARSQNQLLSHFLSWLTKRVEEQRNATLMVDILAANPDLVNGVLTELQASLAPRWSDSWGRLVEWLVSLYSTLSDSPPCLVDKGRKSTDDQATVAMAAVFCLPPSKVALTLVQSLKHEDIRVRHRYLELVQVLLKKACNIQNVLVSSATEQGRSQKSLETLKDLFTATVLKALPPVSQLFVCVEKVLALTAVGEVAGKGAVDAIEQKLCIDLSDHLCLVLQVLSLYQSLTPSLLAQRPRDIARLVQAVTSQLTTDLEDTGTDPASCGAENIKEKDTSPGVEEATSLEGDADNDAKAPESETSRNLLPQLYLLKLLSETDARTLSLGREGVLEKLLLSARHNTRYMNLTISLICKMLQSMEIFSGHGEELAVWLRNALDASRNNTDNKTNGDDDDKESSTPGKRAKKDGKKIKPDRQSNLELVSFLGRCLSTLVNNPTPYADRVMEALAESPHSSLDADGGDGEEKMDVSSVRTNESAREAILLMDDKELDKLVASTAVTPDDVVVNASAAANNDQTAAPGFDLQVSPLVLVALDQLKFNDKAEAGSRAYVSRVVLDLLHSLPSPTPLVCVVERSGLTQQLSLGVGSYLQSWLPHKPALDLSGRELSLCDLFTSMVMSLRCRGNDCPDLSSPKKFHKFWKQLCREMSHMTSMQRLTGLGQVMLYMGELVSGKTKIASCTQVVHMYRLVSEKLIESILEEQEYSTDAQSRDTTNPSNTSLNPRTEDEERILEILSSLKAEEGFPYKAVRRALSSSALIHFLTSPKGFTPRKKKSVKVEKSVSAISVDEDVLGEVLGLLKNVWEKCIQSPWLGKETELVQQHVDIALDILMTACQDDSNKRKSGKGKKEGDEEGKISAQTCCVQILHLLYPNLSLVALSQGLSRLLKFPPGRLLAEDKDDGEDDGSDIGGGQSGLSALGELLVKILQHWADLTATKLAPEGLEVLFNCSSERCGSALPVANAKCLKLKVMPSFEELCRLGPQDFRPFFKLVFSSDSASLRSCAVDLLEKVAQLTPVCGECVPELILASPVKLEARIGMSMAAKLVKSDKRAFQCADAWLQGRGKKPLKRNEWWLMKAFLEARASCLYDCKKSVKVLKESLAVNIQDVLTSDEEDNLSVLKLTCSAVRDDDVSFQEKVFLSTDVLIRDRPQHLAFTHYNLLQTCSEFCGTVTAGGKVVKTDALTLDLALGHLEHLASGKKREETWEGFLMTLALALVTKQTCQDLSFLVSYWSSFVKNTLRHLYKNHKLLDLLSSLAPNVYRLVAEDPSLAAAGTKMAASSSKPSQFLSAQTLFQMCSSHTAFFPVMMSEEFPKVKAGVVRLLHTLGEIEPSCYQKQLRTVLVGAYGATLSLTDQRLLHMIEMTSQDAEGRFECPVLWGKGVLEQHSVSQALGTTLHSETSVANTLAQLDVRLLQRSMLKFPLRRTLVGREVAVAEDYKSKEECYDPRFLLRLFAHVLTPDKQVPLHQFVDKGCLGYLLVALSSHVLALRLLAYQALNDLHLHAQGSRWAERSEVSFLLDLLNASRGHDGQKLSFAVSLFLARVTKLFLNPADPLYMPIFRFLVARPEMDLKSVPEFYKLFFSPGSNYRLERNWVLSLLAEGLRETSDYWLYQKKSVFRIILSFYGSSISDKHSQSLVLSIVKAACSEKTVAVHLVKNHGLLAWLASSVAGLEKRPEHAELLCEIVHTLWTSLTSTKHLGDARRSRGKPDPPAQGRQGSAEDIVGQDEGDKDIKANTEASSSDEDGDNDNDDDSSDNEDDDSSDNEDDDSSDSDEDKEDPTDNREKDEDEDESNSSDGDSSSNSELKSRKRKKHPKHAAKKKQKVSSSETAKDKRVLTSVNKSLKGNGDGANTSQTAAVSEAKPCVTAGDTRTNAGVTSEQSVPKSTVVELSLIVKNLIWQLSSCSLKSMGKVLEVLRGLMSQYSPSLVPGSDAETPGLATNSPADQPPISGHHLVNLSAVDVCLILHQLGTAAQLRALVTAAEAGLVGSCVNVAKLASQGVSGASKKEVVGGENPEKGVAREKKVGVEEQADDEVAGEDVEGLSAAQTVEDESLEQRECSEGGGESLDKKEQAKKLLVLLKDIVALSGSLEFV